NLTGTGVMAYVEIPAIGVSLPIYHGISDEVLKFAIGHLDWSSLPVGGAGTHCVVSGHRGLPSAKLFTDLDEIVEGDIFVLRVLDSILTYEVDRISIVEPTDTAQLLIEEGSDYCTLVTCTPYGINSHRLLIRGHRIENQAQSRTVRVVSEAIRIDPMVVAPIVLIPILFVSIILLLLADKADARQRGGESDEEEI
ncbi:MAG: class C sortase, partial [Ruminococcaceae bacterium]|nr:class C sortase [Oscillospiraceae bacterium]